MGLMGNGRTTYDSTSIPRLMTTQERERTAQRELNERPQRDNLSEILTRASQTPDGVQRLKETVASITREPRTAINEIEQEIASLRDLIAVREQLLVEAIDQHANLSKEAVRGMGVVRQALAQIRDAFNAAMRPTPTLDKQAEGAGPASHVT
jgi:uncharacterized membrane protein YccC